MIAVAEDCGLSVAAVHRPAAAVPKVSEELRTQILMNAVLSDCKMSLDAVHTQRCFAAVVDYGLSVSRPVAIVLSPEIAISAAEDARRILARVRKGRRLWLPNFLGHQVALVIFVHPVHKAQLAR
mgnify:CR=1 FL=1